MGINRSVLLKHRLKAKCPNMWLVSTAYLQRQVCTQPLRGGGTAEVADPPLVLVEEPELVHLLVDQELGVADILDRHPSHHLAAPRGSRDDLDCVSLMR